MNSRSIFDLFHLVVDQIQIGSANVLSFTENVGILS